MGFGYLGYIPLILGTLLDIYFNKAKLTTMIINGAANVFGHAESTIQADWFMRLMRHT
jgi:hypothetical protein